MNIDIASHQARTYTVATPVYEGPLDLLLQLIERAELDITKLALAQVTDQYLEYLRRIQERAAEQGSASDEQTSASTEEVSAFLVIAAKLIQIKSEVLLPRPTPREEGEEDPGEALARQLLAYKRYKKIADFLASQEEANLRTYLRLAPPPKVEGNVDLSDLSLVDLVSAAREVLLQVDNRPALKTVVTPSPVTIRQKIRLIAQLLREHERLTFFLILNGALSRIDVVVTFLAMLELIKRNWIQVQQEKIFGEIQLKRAETWDENEEFELEFGE